MAEHDGGHAWVVAMLHGDVTKGPRAWRLEACKLRRKSLFFDERGTAVSGNAQAVRKFILERASQCGAPPTAEVALSC